MIIGGFQKYSLSAFPQKIILVIFTRGCTFRCPCCHNPELVNPRIYATLIPEEYYFIINNQDWENPRSWVTTGEPTIYDSLPEFIAGIKSLGFLVKLDTNGSNPALLEEMLRERLLDFIAMDIKASLASYSRAAGVTLHTRDIERSISCIIGSGLPHKLRTTYLEPFLSLEDMKAIAELARGCSRFALRGFRFSKVLAPEMLKQAEPSLERP